jgi:hypothetical protein
MAARKCINDFSPPSNANIRIGPEPNVGDGNFELKPALINMVQQSLFCGRFQRMPMPIFNIYWRSATHSPSEESPRTRYVSVFSHSHYWGRQSSSSMPIRKLCPPGRSAPLHFSPSFFRWARPMPSETISRAFNSSRMKPLPRHGSDCRIISTHVYTMEWKSGSSSRASIMG